MTKLNSDDMHRLVIARRYRDSPVLTVDRLDAIRNELSCELARLTFDDLQLDCPLLPTSRAVMNKLKE